MFGIGFQRKIEELANAKGKVIFAWRVVRGKKTVEKGWHVDEAGAEAEANEAVGRAMAKNTEDAAARYVHKARLRRLAETRPYLTVGFCQRLFAGFSRERLMKEAHGYEREMWEAEESKDKRPLSTHHRTLGAADAAAQLWESMKVCLMINEDTDEPTKAARKWAAEMFGEEIFQ